VRFTVAALLLAFGAPVGAADKNEVKAKEAAVAFLKAIKAKDVDAVVKVSSAPFVTLEDETTSVLKDEAALKTWLKERLEEIKDADKVPTEIDQVIPFADVKGKIKDEAERKTIEDAVGKDGFVAVFTVDGKMISILVRIKDGKTKVVGVAR